MCSSVCEDALVGLDFVDPVVFVACVVGTCACARTARSARFGFAPHQDGSLVTLIYLVRSVFVGDGKAISCAIDL